MCESRFTVLRLVFPVAVAVCISNCQAVAQEAPASPDPPVEPAISPEDAQRIQAKANAVLAEVQAQAAAGNVRQEVIAKMEKRKRCWTKYSKTLGSPSNCRRASRNRSKNRPGMPKTARRCLKFRLKRSFRQRSYA